MAPRLAEPEETVPETAEMEMGDMVRAGLPFLLASAALVVNVRVEKLLLGLMTTPEDVAVFQIAWLGFIAGYGPIRHCVPCCSHGSERCATIWSVWLIATNRRYSPVRSSVL